jgi:AsmA protein
MRNVGIAIAVIVVVIIVAVAVFAATFDVNRYRNTIQADLTKIVRRDVSLGEMHLDLFPPRFVVRDVTIADDPTFETHRPFVQAQELDVSIKPLPLLHKSVEIDSLYLQRPAVELIKNSRGTWNFASLGGASREPSSTQHKTFSLSKLVIQDGQVATTDEQTRQPRSVYDHIDVTLRDFAPNEPFSLEAAAHLPGPNNQQFNLHGKGGPVRQDQPAATPFHGTLDWHEVEIAGARRFVSSPALANADGSLSGQMNISSDAGKLSATGNISGQNLRMKGHDLGFPIALQFNIHDDVPADLLMIDSANLKLGATPLSLSGTVNSKPTPAQIDLRAKANGISIAEAAKLAAAAGVALTSGTTVSGTVDLNVEARGAADNPALSGTINGRDLQASGKDFVQPVQIKAVTLSLTPSQIQSNPFTVNSGSTALTAQFSMQRYLSKSPTVDATVRAINAELPSFLSMAKAYGITALDEVSGSGTLDVDLRAAGPVRSAAYTDLARALNGTIGLNFHDVRYSGADISHELTKIAGALGLHENNQGFTNINKMTGNINVKSGIAQTNNTEALLDIGNVGIAGTANLVNQALNLRITGVLSNELSQKAGGTSIGGYAKTVLANNQGELVIPASVTGTFQHPQFAPDLQQLAQMKLKGLVPNFNNPAGAVSGLLGSLLNSKGGNGAQSQNRAQPRNPTASPNPLQQLEGIFRKKKQLQPPPK